MINKPTTIVCIIGLCVLTAFAGQPEPSKPDAGPRNGVYDSRAIAIAFVGPEAYKATNGKKMSEMKVEYDKAKADDDRERMAELEAWGKAQQALAHQQGFSTAPVDDILEHIQDRIPGILKAADVDVMVSKWDEETLAGHTSAERVDITMALVKAFNPTERQLKSATEIQEHPPISLKEAENIDD